MSNFTSKNVADRVAHHSDVEHYVAENQVQAEILVDSWLGLGSQLRNAQHRNDELRDLLRFWM